MSVRHIHRIHGGPAAGALRGASFATHASTASLAARWAINPCCDGRLNALPAVKASRTDPAMGPSLAGGNGGGGGNGNGGSRAPGLIIYNSTNCNLWSGSIVTIFNNSSGYVSDEILIQGIGNSYSESIYLDSAGTYKLQVRFFKSNGGNLNKSFSVNVSETSMTKYEITCN